MQTRRGRRATGQSRARRRRAAALLLLAVVAVFPVRALLAATTTGARGHRTAGSDPKLVVVAGAERVNIRLGPFIHGGSVSTARLAIELRRRLPARAVVRRGVATIVFRYLARRTAVRAARLGIDGGTLPASRAPVRSSIGAPVIAQQLRNDCEAAALQIAVATRGVRTSQQRILDVLPRSEPLDPLDQSSGRIWGDPDKGFVGRPEGGGPAGGFGVYPGPLRAAAERLGVDTDDLTGQPPRRIYARLLYGKAVIAWVGLTDGPYETWRSSAGRAITVNFGEHTVVLTGVGRDGSIRVVNPLEGTLERWPRSQFEQMWSLLGHRALAIA